MYSSLTYKTSYHPPREHVFFLALVHGSLFTSTSLFQEN